MNVFVSYKREDEVRVGRLVRALEGAGLQVWWDRSLGGGENWSFQIQAALDAAKCVVVVWTHASVAPAADFVRDEARKAKLRGILVPVLLDKVNVPLGFGETQCIDLTHWKGNSRDPFFLDLCSAVAAKLDGRPVPAAKGPMKLLARRAVYGSFASAMVIGGLAFGLNLLNVQDRLCELSLLQPQASDACGAFGLGHRPTRRERIAWEHREIGSCAALRIHIERFPAGVYRDQASSMLAARKVTPTETWEPATHQLVLFEPPGDVPSANRTAAEASAVARGQANADGQCGGFAATNSFRVKSARPVAEVWDCIPVAKQVTCGFRGKAVCEMEVRRIVESENCGK
jgi:hypothetical protein